MEIHLKKSERELNDEIMDLTMQIEKTCPELSKYIEEMPDTISPSTGLKTGIEELEAYLESLYNLFHRYIHQHPTGGHNKQST